jgi:hypothetical protein
VAVLAFSTTSETPMCDRRHDGRRCLSTEVWPSKPSGVTT